MLTGLMVVVGRNTEKTTGVAQKICVTVISGEFHLHTGFVHQFVGQDTGQFTDDQLRVLAGEQLAALASASSRR